jgi:hypothetical protein
MLSTTKEQCHLIHLFPHPTLKEHLHPTLFHNQPVMTTHSNFIIAESSENSRSHEGYNDDCCLLGHDAVYPSRSVQMYQRRSFFLYQECVWNIGFRARTEFFLFGKICASSLGPTQVLFNGNWWLFERVVKWQGSEVNYFPLSDVES